MAYIHVKRIGEKKYYTLRISVRKGNKVLTKDIANLGSDISKIKIEDLEKKHGKEIRKSYVIINKFLNTNYYLDKINKSKFKKDSYLSKEQLIEVEAIKLHFNSKFLKQNELTQKQAYGNFILNFSVNSTSIEGNTITLKEAGRLFRENIVPKNKDLREVHDLTNTKKTLEFLEGKKTKITLKFIEEIHDMLLDNIDDRKGIRTHDIRILGQPFKPSPARYIKSDMELLLRWYEENKEKIHPLALATFFHHKFENIHPFSDGNGRTGRVLINYILSLKKYPPLIISRKFRKEYLNAINKADKSIKKSLIEIDMVHYKDLIKFIVSQFKLSYWDIFLI